jgi:hypothetical protein
MALDLDTALKALGAMALLGAGALINHLMERRPRLLVYYGHVAAFQVTPPEAGAVRVGVNTHAVVIRNAGRATTHNVRVPHWGLLADNVPPIHVSVFPDIQQILSRGLVPAEKRTCLISVWNVRL